MRNKPSPILCTIACSLLLSACTEPELTTTLEVPLPAGTTSAHVYAAARARTLQPYAPHGDTILLAPASKAIRDPFLAYWITLAPRGGQVHATMWVEAYDRAAGTSLPEDMALLEEGSPSGHGRVIAEEDDPLGAWTQLRALARQLETR